MDQKSLGETWQLLPVLWELVFPEGIWVLFYVAHIITDLYHLDQFVYSLTWRLT